jgi:hypothetical protein
MFNDNAVLRAPGEVTSFGGIVIDRAVVAMAGVCAIPRHELNKAAAAGWQLEGSDQGATVLVRRVAPSWYTGDDWRPSLTFVPARLPSTL